MEFTVYARNLFSDPLWQENIRDYQKPAATPGAFFMETADTKSNIIIIWDTDIGQSNVSTLASGRD